jgi:ABC-type polysaccharide/polyol phosphate transport system ATPase subunit
MRLNFSLSVSVDPDILLLDEWLSVADQHFRDKAERHMQGLVDKSRILVLASHNLDLLGRLCTRGIFLESGQVRFAGTMAETVGAYAATRSAR